MGTPDFAVPSLEILLENNYSIVAVVTAPEKPRGRGQKYSPTPVSVVAQKHHLSLFSPHSLREDNFIESMRAQKPDLMVVVAFRILPPEVFTVPRLGSFNLHASLLPKYRGAAPINHAIINGEKETGVTTFFLQEKVDTGNILLQARVPITKQDDAGTMHDKLAEVGAEIVLHTVRLIEQGRAKPQRQDNALATPAPKIFKADCRIDWSKSSQAILNFIRGLAPYPGAYCFHDGKMLKILRSNLTTIQPSGEPGHAETTPASMYVRTSDGMLSILEVKLEGKRRMPIDEFLRGYELPSGSILN